jgi:hypothetical protein
MQSAAKLRSKTANASTCIPVEMRGMQASAWGEENQKTRTARNPVPFVNFHRKQADSYAFFIDTSPGGVKFSSLFYEEQMPWPGLDVDRMRLRGCLA